MVTVGVLVHALEEELGLVERRLSRLESVSGTIALERPGTIGVVIEGRDLDEVYASLSEEVQQTEGVLAAWPVHAELEQTPEQGPAADPANQTNPLNRR